MSFNRSLLPPPVPPHNPNHIEIHQIEESDVVSYSGSIDDDNNTTPTTDTLTPITTTNTLPQQTINNTLPQYHLSIPQSHLSRPLSHPSLDSTLSFPTHTTTTHTPLPTTQSHIPTTQSHIPTTHTHIPTTHHTETHTSPHTPLQRTILIPLSGSIGSLHSLQWSITNIIKPTDKVIVMSCRRRIKSRDLGNGEIDLMGIAEWSVLWKGDEVVCWSEWVVSVGGCFLFSIYY